MKPGHLGDSEKDWVSWAFQFINYLDAHHSDLDLRKILQWAAAQETTITDSMVKTAFSDDGDESDAVEHLEGFITAIPNIASFQKQLYGLVTSYLKSNVLTDIARNMEKGNGLELWRKLAEKYDPATPAKRSQPALQNYLSSPCWKGRRHRRLRELGRVGAPVGGHQRYRGESAQD